MEGFLDTATQLCIDWGYWGLFLSAFVAGSIVPFSSEAVMVVLVRFRPHRNRVVYVCNAVFVLFCHTFVIRGGRMMLLKQFAPTS